MTQKHVPLKILFLGLRGFPGVQGGVETHAEHLCPLLVKLGCAVTVLTRSPYHPKEVGAEWQGVTFVSLWAPKSKGLEAIVHSFLGVLYAAIKRPDILHIQAIGPGIMTLIARMMGLRVVTTHHGPDYDRQKWGRFARWVLQTGELMSMRFAHQRIVISQVIRNMVRTKHHVDSILIPNGVTLPNLPTSFATLNNFALKPARYVLLVSRFVPEKRHLDLIEAFRRAAIPGWKLAIVGQADHPDQYVNDVLNAAQVCPGIVCTGFQSGRTLQELYTHAGLFVLPSSHEGLPIALLEALSYGLPVIASDIPANLELGLDPEHYFPLGQIDTLAERLKAFAKVPIDAAIRAQRRSWVTQRYDWSSIAEQTLRVYAEAMGIPNTGRHQ